MQTLVIEYARNVCGLEAADSTEFNSGTPHRVIFKLRELKGIDELGGTMRLGSWACRLAEGSVAHNAYGTKEINERHRHRYEFNPRYRTRLEEGGLRCSGASPDDRLVEFIELPSHPFWIGTQAHPEFKSRPDRPHPLFRELVGAALARAEGRKPRLLQVDPVPQAR